MKMPKHSIFHVEIRAQYHAPSVQLHLLNGKMKTKGFILIMSTEWKFLIFVLDVVILLHVGLIQNILNL